MIIYPKNGYAFIRKDGEGYPCLALTLGSGDSIENYQEITEEEYMEKMQDLNAANIPEFII